MYISKIKLHNFKGFKGDHELNFNIGVNFLVGNNNCGKSSVFEAIDFIRTNKEKEDIITKTKVNENVSVKIEIKFTEADFVTLLEKDALKKYKSYLIDDDANGTKTLRVMRSSEESNVTQNKKDKHVSIKNVRIYNPKTKQFENPTGIDATITDLFDAQFVWADINSGDVANFSKNKICGKIINTIIRNNISANYWKDFEKSHEETFKKLADDLKPTKEKIQRKLSEQYGDTEVKFDFSSFPNITEFLSLGNIVLSDSNDIETTSTEKGTGMQRALALALIQVYADIFPNTEETISKPIMFFIDEPETFLHPQAQNKLIDALEKISTKSQIFIITHSPYLLKNYKKDTHSLNIFEKDDNGFNKKPKPNTELGLFGKSSLTWVEINYLAFGVITEEFHNELYGFIQAKAVEEDSKNEKQENFDEYICSKDKDIKKNKKWRKGTQSEKDTTLPTYIRNFIHHPENDKNEKYTEEELKNSIEKLISLRKLQKLIINC
jgi:predicted ATP-dependent endonuclease of OLD family